MKLMISLLGFGKVGRQFVKLVRSKEQDILSWHGIEAQFVAVSSSRGFISDPTGLDIDVLTGMAIREENLAEHPLFVPYDQKNRIDGSLPEVSSKDCVRVLVAAASSDFHTGEPSLSVMKSAISRGWHIASMEKSPLVVAFDELTDMAKKFGVKIRYSGATAAGLPAIDIAKISLAGSKVLSIEGILNATTNYVLTLMSEDGVSYEEALSMARAHGYAEPDPTRDVMGIDTAMKILLIANAAMGCRKKLSDVKITGITHITPRDVASWAVEQRTLKMIGKAWREDDDVKIEVAPMAVPYYDLFAKVNGSGKAVRFVTDLFGELVLSVQEGGPVAAAGSGFKDILNIFRSLQGRV